MQRSSAQPQTMQRPRTAPKYHRPASPIIPNRDDILSIARGTPFFGAKEGGNRPRSASNKKDNEQISALLKQQRRLETEIFKLPTNPRSLTQRKRKQSLEADINGIERQIVALKSLR